MGEAKAGGACSMQVNRIPYRALFLFGFLLPPLPPSPPFSLSSLSISLSLSLSVCLIIQLLFCL